MKDFHSLSEKEILALAISLEEEDERVYADLYDGTRQDFPASAAVFDAMRQEEVSHRRRLIDLYHRRFGEHIPLIRRQDVRGFVKRKPIWLARPLPLNQIRSYAAAMEIESRRFYEKAAARTSDPATRQLLDDLAEEERSHENRAEELQQGIPQATRMQEEQAEHKLFLLQVVQPGLAGMIDGSISTLAPVFAAAFATRRPHEAFLVGLAASLGAGVSMGFTEALSDDGTLTGRGRPLLRGFVEGAMTALGGLGHTLPFLIPSFHLAVTVAAIVVIIELASISFIRYKYMDMPPFKAALQVALGGAIVFAIGVLIGSS